MAWARKVGKVRPLLRENCQKLRVSAYRPSFHNNAMHSLIIKRDEAWFFEMLLVTLLRMSFSETVAMVLLGIVGIKSTVENA
jgi:hypothetical protein